MPKKVLIIEDEEIIQDLLQRRLSKEGYQVFSARDGEQGLRAMRSRQPDLILLDIVMPKKGGLEVMEEMQKDEMLRTIPIVIISNSGQPAELEKAKELGARDWLIKTEFDPKEVVAKVKKQFGESVA